MFRNKTILGTASKQSASHAKYLRSSNGVAYFIDPFKLIGKSDGHPTCLPRTFTPVSAIFPVA